MRKHLFFFLFFHLSGFDLIINTFRTSAFRPFLTFNIASKRFIHNFYHFHFIFSASPLHPGEPNSNRYTPQTSLCICNMNGQRQTMRCTHNKFKKKRDLYNNIRLEPFSYYSNCRCCCLCCAMLCYVMLSSSSVSRF